MCSSGACVEPPAAVAASAIITTTGATWTPEPAALHKWNLMDAPGSTVVDYIGGASATHVSGASASSPAGDGADRTIRGVRLGTKNAPQSHIELDFVETALGGAMTIEMVVMFDKFNEHSRIFSCSDGADDADAMIMRSIDVPSSTGKAGVVGSRLAWDVHQGTTQKRALTQVTTMADWAGLRPTRQPLIAGQRYHIVATVSGSTMKTFINGVAESHKVDGWEPATKRRSTCTIGKPSTTPPPAGHDPHGYFSGVVSSLAIYRGAMTPAQVTAAYQKAFPILEFAWDFRGVSSSLTQYDDVQGVAATIECEQYSCSAAGRKSTGISLSGTEQINIPGMANVRFGGPMTIETVHTFKAAYATSNTGIGSWAGALFQWQSVPEPATGADSMHLGGFGANGANTFGRLLVSVFNNHESTGGFFAPTTNDLVRNKAYHIVATSRGADLKL